MTQVNTLAESVSLPEGKYAMWMPSPMSQRPTFKRFDARKLLSQGIEPYPAIRRQVDSLKPGEGLALTAPFLPSPLIEKLRSENFASRVEHLVDGSWITYFWRETDEAC